MTSSRGFTLIEAVIALAVAGVLSAVAYPTYRDVVQRAHRADAITALMQVQMAQERHRADHPRYATLAELRAPAVSQAGQFQLSIVAPNATGYEIRAAGPAAAVRCRHLRLVVDRGNTAQGSGSDERFGNADSLNRRCWGQ